MATMKKTPNNGTLSASTYEVKDAVGIIVGIYGNEDIACIEEASGKLRMLINDEAIEKLGIEVVHTDHKWGE